MVAVIVVILVATVGYLLTGRDSQPTASPPTTTCAPFAGSRTPPNRPPALSTANPYTVLKSRCRSPASMAPSVWRWTPPATSTSPTHLNNRVLKLAAGSATQSVLPFTGLDDPGGVAVDTAGNLYVTDSHNNRVLKLAAGSATPTVLPFTGLNSPSGVAVDTAGNLYVADMTTNGW